MFSACACGESPLIVACFCYSPLLVRDDFQRPSLPAVSSARPHRDIALIRNEATNERRCHCPAAGPCPSRRRKRPSGGAFPRLPPRSAAASSPAAPTARAMRISIRALFFFGMDFLKWARVWGAVQGKHSERYNTIRTDSIGRPNGCPHARVVAVPSFREEHALGFSAFVFCENRCYACVLFNTHRKPFCKGDIPLNFGEQNFEFHMKLT